MLRRGVLAAVLLATVLSACGGDDDGGTSTGSVAPVASDSPAPVPTLEGGGGAEFDCAVVKPLVASAGVNIQLITQLGSIPEVSSWSVSIGSLPDFDTQLAAMSVLAPFDPGVAEQLVFFRGADEIVQRGLGGDAEAPAQLAAYLGDDIAATLARQIPFGAALAAAGC